MTFKHGESGNPGGRPKGTGYRQQLFNSLVDPHKEALFDTAIKLALEGNENMLRLFLERMLPSRPVDDTIYLDFPESDIKKADTLIAYGENILIDVFRGVLTPHQAKTVMAALEIQRKHIETSELVDRVSAVEKILKVRK